MSQIATSIEQSKKLLALGLSPETADMYWDVNDTGGRSYTLHVGKNIAIERDLFSFREGMVVPAWSLSALMEQLPKNDFTGVDYGLSSGWFCQTFDCVSPIFSTPIEAVFDTVCELIENGYRQLPLS